ncbi:Flagellar M-ring protein [Phycisphaerae bacterium RAS1]|nr:Flagellar M-ring protein [Phycisphaerae bacterium RAS1]
MDFLQGLLTRIGAQLRGMSASQKVALLLGALLVAGSLGWLAQWAAAPEMVALLDQPLSAQELARVKAGLDLMNEPARISGQQVLVRGTANRPALLAQLQLQDNLPSDTSAGFDALVKESNPWISQAEHDRRWTVALQSEIEQVLRQFSGVKAARVFVDMGMQRRGFTKDAPLSSASVTLIMKSGEQVSRDLALAAARTVSGAVRGLPLRNVQVVDGSGVVALDWEQGESGGGGLHRERVKQEKLIEEKIRGLLAADPRVRVNVRVELDLASRAKESRTLTDPVEVSNETTEENSARLRRSGQPGVEPNTAVSVSGGGADETQIRSTNRVQSQTGFTHTTETTPGGEIQSSFAAINLSYSYLESIYRRLNPGTDPAPPAKIQDIFDQEKSRVVALVAKLLKPAEDSKDEDQVAVSWYYDAPESAGPPQAGSSLDTALDVTRRYGPQAGLGLLALLSLGLMLRMARSSATGDSFGIELGLPQEAIEAAKQAADDAASAAGRRTPVTGGRGAGSGRARGGAGDAAPAMAIPVAGQAAAAEGVLVAQEVNEHTVQTRKMLEQVSDVAAGDASSVATLMEQWIRRTESSRR